MQNYRNLIVWQKAHLLTLDVYAFTKNFPNYELYGITSQLRRASTSVPTNLAEGSGKQTDKEFKRFVNISFGSANELEYLLFLSYCLNYLTEAEYLKADEQTKEIKRMLSGLNDSLARSFRKPFLFFFPVVAGLFLFFAFYRLTES